GAASGRTLRRLRASGPFARTTRYCGRARIIGAIVQVAEPQIAAPRRMLTVAEIAPLDKRFSELPTEEVLGWAWERFGDKAAIGTSFQGAGLLMMHVSQTCFIQCPVFTLDSGQY